MKWLLQSLGLTLSLLSSFSLSTRLQAIPISPVLVASVHYTPPPPPDRGAPGNRGEGASRGCAASNTSLMALVPEQTLSTSSDTAAITQVWGLTSTTHPRFWFSVPYAPTQVSAIEFVLQNNQDQVVYRTPVTVPTMPGILSVQLPSTVEGLAIDQPYHWFFKVRVLCEPNQAPTLTYVEGWIQRTQLDASVSDRLTQATPYQQAILYAENGVWYDALTTLAELRISQPDDPAIAQDWRALLQGVGLEDLITQDFIH